MVSLSGEKIGDSLNIGNVFIPIRHSVRQSPPENLVLSTLSRMEKAPKRIPKFERAISKMESFNVNVRTVEDISRVVDQVSKQTSKQTCKQHYVINSVNIFVVVYF